ncbi:MAG: hypothetical protein HY540_01070 [Deltaproteobacteria bacterium]|nr:hypothetical protein [Deltaproteobacteria bacterium]
MSKVKLITVLGIITLFLAVAIAPAWADEGSETSGSESSYDDSPTDFG